MSNVQYGYRIENGKAVIDEMASKQVNKLYLAYLEGLSLKGAATKVGINCCHTTIGKMLENKIYLGDEFYPPIINEETFNKVKEKRQIKAEKLGRIRETKAEEKLDFAVNFKIKVIEQKYDDPFKQAEYIYSLIESEV